METLPELPPGVYVAKDEDYNAPAARAAAALLARRATEPCAACVVGRRRFRAFPVYRGRVALCRPALPAEGRWSYLVFSSPYARWAQVFEPELAIARAGYDIRTDIGRDCRLTVTRMWVDRDGVGGWVAFANARQLSGDARLEAHVTVPLDVELTHLTSGYLAGTTPGAWARKRIPACMSSRSFWRSPPA